MDPKEKTDQDLLDFGNEEDGKRTVDIRKRLIYDPKVINFSKFIIVCALILTIFSAILYTFFPNEASKSIWEVTKYIDFGVFASILTAYFKDKQKMEG